MGDRFLSAVLAFCLMALMTSEALADRVVPATKQQVTLSYAPLVKKAAPAVVNIYTRKVVRTRSYSPLFDDPFFRRFFGDALGGLPAPGRKRVQNSLGSGVIVDGGGVVVTNHHVIEGADDVTVVLADRREFEAQIVGSDERTDLAVLKIDTGGETLPSLQFHDSDEIEVGDLVLAIGNPFGVGQTVTSGIISAVARTNVGISDLSSFIQTDASINPGNSGGALVTMDGRLVGINSAIYSKGGGSVGIGFAIPANMVRSVVDGLLSGGKLIRPWLGAEGQGMTQDIAASLGLKRPVGVLINGLYQGGPAERGGLKLGDVVLRISDKPVDDGQAMRYRLATLPLGAKADFTVWRRGKEVVLKVPVEAPPEKPVRDETLLKGNHPMAGATVANLNPALNAELGVNLMDQGVMVLAISPRSPAHRLRFKVGDVILAINGQDVASVDGLKGLLTKRVGQWRITLERDGRTLNLAFSR